MHEFFSVATKNTSILEQLLQFTPDVNSYKIVYFKYILFITYILVPSAAMYICHIFVFESHVVYCVNLRKEIKLKKLKKKPLIQTVPMLNCLSSCFFFMNM